MGYPAFLCPVTWMMKRPAKFSGGRADCLQTYCEIGIIYKWYAVGTGENRIPELTAAQKIKAETKVMEEKVYAVQKIW